MLVLEVTVDGLGHTDNLHAGIMSLVVFGQNGGIGVAVITTDDYQSRDFEFAQNLQTGLKLFRLFKLGAARADNIKATSIAVLFNHVACDFNVAMLDKTVRSAQEAVQTAVLVQRLDAVIETADHVVTTGCLSAAEDDTHVEGLLGRHGRIIAFKGQLRHAIGGWEKFFNSILVGHRLSGFSLDRAHRAPEGDGQFGPIGQPHVLH